MMEVLKDMAMNILLASSLKIAKHLKQLKCLIIRYNYYKSVFIIYVHYKCIYTNRYTLYDEIVCI
jgi:hypothetical protein